MSKTNEPVRPLFIERGRMDFVIDHYRTCRGWMLEGGRIGPGAGPGNRKHEQPQQAPYRARLKNGTESFARAAIHRPAINLRGKMMVES